MLLEPREIDEVCRRWPEAEAWIGLDGSAGADRLQHFGGSARATARPPE
jgi:hypothetical protein